MYTAEARHRHRGLLPRDVIESSPEFDPTSPVVRDYETALHGHYRKPGYWSHR